MCHINDTICIDELVLVIISSFYLRTQAVTGNTNKVNM